MTLASEGEAPGPVRFYLACDWPHCDTHTMFDLVVAEPAPPIEEDFLGHLMHTAQASVGRVRELGWTYHEGIGHWCSRCSDPVDRARWKKPD
ncbi:hypothetical protein ACIGJO_34180 [Streptomyces sp. NPDC079020]|uniref:hypothetical protein n=1 Tax=unclassified Streptomyces TaxID=2593676 RepID=UPI0022528D56|nr:MULTISPECIES: hypothetical protein [unclassified Streptomyces]MCX4964028.1 hypothetical protein [Streptomyces sp. NBC_00654]MEE1739141.1 hypothetical protein [Streptomyces sp. BE147]